MMIIQKNFHVSGMRIGMNEFDRRIFITAWAAARKAWKIQAWMGIQTLTSAMLYHCYQSNWEEWHPLDVEIDDDSTGIFHVFEMQIRINDIDHHI